MIELTLPAPPSPNAIWRAVGGRVIKSAAFRSWQREAALLVMAQRPKPIAGPVAVHIRVQTNNRRDLDGYLKATLDLLVSQGLIADDRCKIVRQIGLEWADDIEGIAIVVKGLQS